MARFAFHLAQAARQQHDLQIFRNRIMFGRSTGSDERR
jgi:hypothetical protein